MGRIARRLIDGRPHVWEEGANEWREEPSGAWPMEKVDAAARELPLEQPPSSEFPVSVLDAIKNAYYKTDEFYNTGPDEKTRVVDMTGQAPVFDSDAGPAGTTANNPGDNRAIATELGLGALLAGGAGAKLVKAGAAKAERGTAFAEKLGHDWAAGLAPLGKEYAQDKIPEMIALARRLGPERMMEHGSGALAFAKKHPVLALLGAGAAGRGAHDIYESIKRTLGIGD